MAQWLRLGMAAVLLGLSLALAVTLLVEHIAALAAGLALYAFGVGISNATLYRLTLFSSESAKGAVSALLGMIPIAIFALGIALFSTLGAGAGLSAWIVAATAPAFAARVPVVVVLSGRESRGA